MRVAGAVSLFVGVVLGAVACRHAAGPAPPQPSIAAAPRAAESTTAEELEIREINDRFAREIAERIAGREDEPAEKVFENIQWLEGIPAGRLLRIMNRGYARALGVACTHCHVEGDFASDEKRPKRAAREMAAMHRGINEKLKTMKNLDSEPENRAINCSTCHRGAVDPMAASR